MTARACHTNQQGQHRNDIDAKVVDEYRVRHADLVIVDAVIGMEGQGPHAGSPIEMNLILAGTDTVAVDAVPGPAWASIRSRSRPSGSPATTGSGSSTSTRSMWSGRRSKTSCGTSCGPTATPSGSGPAWKCSHPAVLPRLLHQHPRCDRQLRARTAGSTSTSLKDKLGEVVFITGGQPDLDPESCRDKVVFLVGDCWEYFPSAPKIREALTIARQVIERPGCAPVYVFAQINSDLIDLGTEAGLLAHV